ncbi:helix-turn-helix domain-containing protein [Dolosigranulum pigrum]
MNLLLEHEIEHFVDWLKDKDMWELGEGLYLSKFDVKKLKKGKLVNRGLIKRLMELYNVDTQTLFGEKIPYIEYSIYDVGDRVRQAREDKEMDRFDLAEEIYMSDKSITNWEFSLNSVNRIHLENIAYATGLTDEEFFTMELVDVKTIFPYIELLLDKLDLTHEKLARIIGVEAPSISAWKRDIACPQLNNVKKVVKIVGLSLKELAGMSLDEFGIYLNEHYADIMEEEGC